MVNRELLTQFLQVYTFQPATAFWRAVEIDVLRKYMPTSGTVLDLGCGDGKLTVILYGDKPLGHMTLVGIDIDSDETRHAKLQPIYTRVHTCSASSIPEESGSFDGVVSNSVLEHLENIEDTISEVTRLLKPGGVFTFTVPSQNFHRCLQGPIMPGASRDTYLQEMDKRLLHYRYWDINDWQAMLDRYGLSIEQHAEYLTLIETRRWEMIHRFTGGILYNIFGKKNKPIELQKKLGLRNAQNRISLPAGMARFFARVLTLGVKSPRQKTASGGLLVVARKNGPMQADCL